MKYVSTRGGAPAAGFADVLLGGLAPDGGLYMPDSWPRIEADEIARFARQPYWEAAFAVLRRFVGNSISEADLKTDVQAAYSAFTHPATVPLVQLGPGLFLLELFHGPTLAFKDVAMQLLARLLARTLRARGERATVLAATSGDTGAAAVAALHGLPGIDLVVLYPRGRVSDIQRRQMTTAKAANVHCVAIDGAFDDAQAVVKALFTDAEFAKRKRLIAVNSINWTRIAAQTVYYFAAAAALGAGQGRALTFAVPTGNFGDVFAGEAAARMGLPVERLIVATNSNDALRRAFQDGVCAVVPTVATLSPAMDIQMPSNFERALYEASGRNARWLGPAMADFAAMRRLKLPETVLGVLRGRYAVHRADDRETLETIRRTHTEAGLVVDPHTAVALAAARRNWAGVRGPVVVLSTAHPAKFQEAVCQAIGEAPRLPERLAGLSHAEERVTDLPANPEAVKTFVEGCIKDV